MEISNIVYYDEGRKKYTRARDTQTDTHAHTHTLGNDGVELFNTQALFGHKAVRFLRSFTTPTEIKFITLSAEPSPAAQAFSKKI